MSYSVSDSHSDDEVLPFDRQGVADVILQISRKFDIRVKKKDNTKFCYYCDKDSEQESCEDLCSVCGKEMNTVYLRDIWDEIEENLFKQSKLYRAVYKFLVDESFGSYVVDAESLSSQDFVVLGRIIEDHVSEVLSKEGMEIRSDLQEYPVIHWSSSPE